MPRGYEFSALFLCLCRIQCAGTTGAGSSFRFLGLLHIKYLVSQVASSFWARYRGIKARNIGIYVGITGGLTLELRSGSHAAQGIPLRSLV